jgi:hypothetical protein
VEIWTLKDSRKADKINAGIDLLSETGAAIAGADYATFLAGAKGKGALHVPAYSHIRNLSKVPCYGKPGGMADETLVGFARTSYGIKLGATPANPRPTRAQAEQEARRIGGFWRQAAPFDQDYLNFIRTTRGQDGRYYVVMGHPSIGSVIRRGGCTYCSACNALFQGLGALAAGEITWAVQKACYWDISSPMYGSRLVMHAYDSWLCETKIGQQTQVGTELERLIKVYGATKVPDVMLRAEAVAMMVWDKSAERIVKDGELLIWGADAA